MNSQFSKYDICDRKLAIIQGKAGTGKSCVINKISRKINLKVGSNATL